MTLETGDDVPDVCEGVGSVPLVLPDPAVDPLDFSSTGPEWAFRLPLAENGSEIVAYVSGGADDARPREGFCFASPSQFVLLRLALSRHAGAACVPFRFSFGVVPGDHAAGGDVGSGVVSFVGTSGAVDIPGLMALNGFSGLPGGTWKVVAMENLTASSVYAPGTTETVVASGSFDGTGVPVGTPTTLSDKLVVIVTPGTGLDAIAFGHEFRATCPE